MQRNVTFRNANALHITTQRKTLRVGEKWPLAKYIPTENALIPV